jgi:hypothetical protein
MIKVLKESEIIFDDYENLVMSSEGSHSFHSSGYLKLISEVTNSSLYIIASVDNDRIEAAIPFCVQEGPLGKVANSLPFFGSNGGVISRDSNLELKRQLVAKFLSYTKKIGCISSTIVTSPVSNSFEEYRHFIEFNYFDSRISLNTNLDLRLTPEQLMKSFEDPRPRNIRKAQKSGVVVSIDNTEKGLNFLAASHISNMNSIGGINKSEKFFQEIPKFLEKNSWNNYVALYNNQYVASLLLLYKNKSVEYYTPTTVLEYRQLQPLSLLIFTAMLDAQKLGFNRWNWGGTWRSQTGVYEFKKKWGVTESEYRYYCAVYDSKILNYSAEYFKINYPSFYVVPFKSISLESTESE